MKSEGEGLRWKGEQRPRRRAERQRRGGIVLSRANEQKRRRRRTRVFAAIAAISLRRRLLAQLQPQQENLFVQKDLRLLLQGFERQKLHQDRRRVFFVIFVERSKRIGGDVGQVEKVAQKRTFQGTIRTRRRLRTRLLPRRHLRQTQTVETRVI